MYSPIEDFGKTNENKNIQNMLCDCKFHEIKTKRLIFSNRFDQLVYTCTHL